MSDPWEGRECNGWSTLEDALLTQRSTPTAISGGPGYGFDAIWDGQTYRIGATRGHGNGISKQGSTHLLAAKKSTSNGGARARSVQSKPGVLRGGGFWRSSRP